MDNKLRRGARCRGVTFEGPWGRNVCGGFQNFSWGFQWALDGAAGRSFSHRLQGGRPGFVRLEANLAVGIPKIPGNFLERALIQRGKKRRSPALHI